MITSIAGYRVSLDDAADLSAPFAQPPQGAGHTMSRGYRIGWPARIFTQVHLKDQVSACDQVTLHVSLLGILPEDEMADLLRAELLAAGWRKQSRKDGEALVLTMGAGESAVRAELHPDGTTLTISATGERSVRAVSEDRGEAERILKRETDAARTDLLSQAGERLAKVEPEVQAQLMEVVQRVYVAALRRKAASLGQIESLKETTGADGEREIVIRVKV